MIYLLVDIALFLVIAAALGVGVGWVLRQRTAATEESALRRAQMTLIAARETRHPSFWAPFLLINSWL